MKKFFTLIELIVVIAVLGILAAIIIPNISSFQEEANTTAIKSNVRNLQTGVDMYGLNHYGSVPTMDGQPTEYEPKPIDFDTMIPEYSRDLPETPGVNYWVDGWGKVWASTIDSPENVDLTSATLKWDTVGDADMYKVYKILSPTNPASLLNANTKLQFYKEAGKDKFTGIPVDDDSVQYAVSAVDENGFESAPAGSKYKGYENMLNAGIQEPIDDTYLDTNKVAFEGNGQSYIQKNGVNNFPTTEITMEVWLKTTDSVFAIASYSSGNHYNEFLFHNIPNTQIHIGSSGSQTVSVNYADGQWHHAAITWKSSTGEMKVYKDGVLASTTTYRQGYSLLPNGYLTLAQEQDCIGGCFSDDQAFQGDMNEFRIWNRVLTADEVKNNKDKKLTGNENGLILYYQLDQVNNGTVEDLSGNGNDGTISNVQ